MKKNSKDSKKVKEARKSDRSIDRHERTLKKQGKEVIYNEDGSIGLQSKDNKKDKYRVGAPHSDLRGVLQ